MRILRAADRAAVPWKNGGGVTREVLAWPAGAGMEGFLWRVSIADVREPGPFSYFEGVDRTMAVLRGHLVLAFTDFETDLEPGDAPFTFQGDEPCTGTPFGGPVTDLNVMVRRGRVLANVERVADTALAATADHTLIVAASPVTLHAAGAVHTLDPLDAALIAQGTGVSLEGDAYVITIS
jgi:environmental stress-induced protein Ves